MSDASPHVINVDAVAEVVDFDGERWGSAASATTRPTIAPPPAARWVHLYRPQCARGKPQRVSARTVRLRRHTASTHDAPASRSPLGRGGVAAQPRGPRAHALRLAPCVLRAVQVHPTGTLNGCPNGRRGPLRELGPWWTAL